MGSSPHSLSLGWFSDNGNVIWRCESARNGTKLDFRCPICRSGIGQASCLILRAPSSADVPSMLLYQPTYFCSGPFRPFSPKFCLSHVFNFSWDLQSPQGKLKTMNGNGLWNRAIPFHTATKRGRYLSDIGRSTLIVGAAQLHFIFAYLWTEALSGIVFLWAQGLIDIAKPQKILKIQTAQVRACIRLENSLKFDH